jgi:hypothetical protein
LYLLSAGNDPDQMNLDRRSADVYCEDSDDGPHQFHPIKTVVDQILDNSVRIIFRRTIDRGQSDLQVGRFAARVIRSGRDPWEGL